MLMFIKKEQVIILGMLGSIELSLTDGMSDDLGRYTELGLKLEPNNPSMLSRTENFHNLNNLVYLI